MYYLAYRFPSLKELAASNRNLLSACFKSILQNAVLLAGCQQTLDATQEHLNKYKYPVFTLSPSYLQ